MGSGTEGFFLFYRNCCPPIIRDIHFFESMLSQLLHDSTISLKIFGVIWTEGKMGRL